MSDELPPNNIVIDDTSPFGRYAPPSLPALIISMTRPLGTQWLAKRMIFLLRRLALIGMDKCADTVLFGARLRLYTSGNVSEKRALFSPKLFDNEERIALNKLAAAEAVFIDIGANVGLYSFSVAESFKHFNDTKIIAVEAHPQIARRLKYNCSLNPELNIQIEEVGISDAEGFMPMALDMKNIGQTRLLKHGEETASQTVNVPVMSLMGLIAKHQLTHIDGLKIDVEGHEEAVILPFLETAPDELLPKIIIIEDNRRQWLSDVIAAAAKRGFTLSQKTRLNLIFSR